LNNVIYFITFDSMIYFIQNKDSGHIKIGYTKRNAVDRMRAIGISTHSQLILLGTCEGSIMDERRLHSKFKSDHIKSEWFKGSSELMKYIASLPKDWTPIVAERTLTKSCKECGKEFEAKNHKGTFCSLACRQKDYRDRKNKEFEAFRQAVAGMNKGKMTNPAETTATACNAPKKSNIVRGIQWYVSQIKDLQFEEEYKTMHEMILSDQYLTKKEKESLILSFTNSKL